MTLLWYISLPIILAPRKGLDVLEVNSAVRCDLQARFLESSLFYSLYHSIIYIWLQDK